jgi:4'-phosphopantetheinyl transferase
MTLTAISPPAVSSWPDAFALGAPDIHAIEVTAATAVPIDQYLSSTERETCAALTLPRRRREWLAGRRAAKELVRQRHRDGERPDLREVEIGNLSAGLDRGRPFYRVGGRAGAFGLSISHSGPFAAAALSRQPNQRVGIDIERVERRDASFEALALSRVEAHRVRRLCGVARWQAVTRIWVLKEALLKALGVGLSVPMTGITVDAADVEHSATVTFDLSPLTLAADPRVVLAGRVAAAQLFDMGGLAGAWVVLPEQERACSHY